MSAVMTYVWWQLGVRTFTLLTLRTADISCRKNALKPKADRPLIASALSFTGQIFTKFHYVESLIFVLQLS
jgi:hypothetical protein